jgi:GR25 family glycosyltransferase involved in LPS biosynthesis|tara:strand:+ start:2734 stop:3330 length:597 start_codon:yes stop_codon:yes gene_type:complete
MISDNLWMIQIPDHRVSQHYANLCIPSWDCNVNLFDAYTPNHMPDYLDFNLMWGNRPFSESEKAGFYSHLELWKKCFEEDKPIAIIEHDVAQRKKDMPIIGDFFAFADFIDEDDWKNYSTRFKGHPYWGTDEPLCPVTHAYYMTPDVAESMFYTISEQQINKFVDDYMWEFMGKDKSKIMRYSRPIYTDCIGGTMVHA